MYDQRPPIGNIPYSGSAPVPDKTKSTSSARAPSNGGSVPAEQSRGLVGGGTFVVGQQVATILSGVIHVVAES